MNATKFLTALVALVILIALYFGSAYLRDQAQPTELSNQLTEQSNPTNQQPAETTYQYKYIPNYTPDQPYVYNAHTYDGKIVRIDPVTNQEIVVVPSVKAAYPPVAPINLSLSVLAYSDDSSRVYFTTIPNESDGFPFDIIRYNGPANTFTKLKISNQYDSYAVRATATNSPFIVTTDNPRDDSDDKSLFLLDLEADSSKLIVKLPANETFNFCYQQGCLGGVMGDIVWLNSQYIEASIYSFNETEKDEYGNPANKFIEKRKYKVR